MSALVAGFFSAIPYVINEWIEGFLHFGRCAVFHIINNKGRHNSDSHATAQQQSNVSNSDISEYHLPTDSRLKRLY